MVSVVVLIEHEPQATKAGRPVQKTDRGFQAGRLKQADSRRRLLASKPRKKVPGRWTKVGEPRLDEGEASR